MNEQELQDLFARELRPVQAPEHLWARIETARARPPVARPKRLVWLVPALALAACACFAIYHFGTNRSAEPVAHSDVVPAVASIERAPVYEISQAHTTMIEGEPVRHLVFTPEDRTEAISVFISASKLNLPSHRGQDQPRMVQFPCSKQVCTVVCRKCSAKAVEILSAQLAVETPNFQ